MSDKSSSEHDSDHFFSDEDRVKTPLRRKKHRKPPDVVESSLQDSSQSATKTQSADSQVVIDTSEINANEMLTENLSPETSLKSSKTPTNKTSNDENELKIPRQQNSQSRRRHQRKSQKQRRNETSSDDESNTSNDGKSSTVASGVVDDVADEQLTDVSTESMPLRQQHKNRSLSARPHHSSMHDLRGPNQLHSDNADLRLLFEAVLDVDRREAAAAQPTGGSVEGPKYLAERRRRRMLRLVAANDEHLNKLERERNWNSRFSSHDDLSTTGTGLRMPHSGNSLNATYSSGSSIGSGSLKDFRTRPRSSYERRGSLREVKAEKASQTRRQRDTDSLLPPRIPKNNRGNYTFTREQVHRIENENQRLMREMLVQLDRDKPPRPKRHVQPPCRNLTPSAVNRIYELKRIERENLALLKRLQIVKPTQGMERASQLKDWERQYKGFGVSMYVAGLDGHLRFRRPSAKRSGKPRSHSAARLQRPSILQS